MRTANPALNSKTFDKIGNLTDTSGVMTIQGTVNKTFVILLFLMASATWMWNKFFDAPSLEEAGAMMMPWMIGGALGGFVVKSCV